MAGSFWRTALVAAAAVASVAAKPRSVGSYVSRQSTQEPCAQIASAYSNQNTLFVAADTALACLQSVPLDKAGGAQQIAGLQALISFQSDLSFLIEPTPGYLYPAVDILGGLTAIGNNLNSGKYSNEYDFQLDIFKLVGAAYDGHFAYTSDIVGIFFFIRLFSEQLVSKMPNYYQIISVSTDGVSLPDVYSALDAQALINPNSTSYTPSPITQINGEDVETWLNTYAATSGSGKQQDPDSQYNFLFPSISGDSVPALAGAFGNAFSTAAIYQGTDTVLKYTNGTTQHVLTMAASSATTREKFKGVTDGASFFQTFCTGNILKELQGGGSSGAPSPSSSAVAGSSSVAAKRDIVTARAPQASSFSQILSSVGNPSSFPASSAAPSGSAAVPSSQVPYTAVPTSGVKGSSPLFPQPIVASNDFSVQGYFPEAQDDLAVLSIPSYQPTSNSQFSNVVRELLATAAKYKKTKLIIDLRGNPGGTALMATDTFKQLFPSMDPYGAGNYRANPLFNFTGESLSQYFAGVTYAQAKQDGSASLYAGLPFNVDNEVTKAATDFGSWADFFGPNFYHGDNYTALTRWNLSDPAQRQGLFIYGYGSDDKPQPQTFQAENIVMLSDGACASTCTLFAEMMKNQGHVRSIAVGGRKQNGPMQAVGGIKGANILGMATIFEIIATAVHVATSALQQSFASTFGNGQVIQAMEHALSRASPGGESVVQGSFNFRNNFREGDTTNTPLQYVYEAADWRFFYTAAMYAQQDLVWTKAYDIVWNGGKAVPDSTGQVSSGFGTGYILNKAPAGAAAASGDTIYPSQNLGSAVKPSATTAFSPKKTGGAASVGVSMGVMGAGLAAGLLLV